MSDPDPARLRARVPASLIVTIFVIAAGFHVLSFFGWELPIEIHAFRGPGTEPPKAAMTAIWLTAFGILLWSIRMPTSKRRLRAPLRIRQPLCANCFEPYIEGASFCPTCSRPLSWFANTGPYERIYAEAWIFGKAANRPTHIAHVWVLTLMAVGAFLPVLALTASLVILGAQGQVFLLPPLLAHSAIWGAFARRAWRNWRLRPTELYGSPPWWTRDEHWREQD